MKWKNYGCNNAQLIIFLFNNWKIDKSVHPVLFPRRSCDLSDRWDIFVMWFPILTRLSNENLTKSSTRITILPSRLLHCQIFYRDKLLTGYSDPYCLLGLTTQSDSNQQLAPNVTNSATSDSNTVLSPIAVMTGILGDVRHYVRIRNTSVIYAAYLPTCVVCI